MDTDRLASAWEEWGWCTVTVINSSRQPSSPQLFSCLFHKPSWISQFKKCRTKYCIGETTREGAERAKEAAEGVGVAARSAIPPEGDTKGLQHPESRWREVKLVKGEEETFPHPARCSLKPLSHLWPLPTPFQSSLKVFLLLFCPILIKKEKKKTNKPTMKPPLTSPAAGLYPYISENVNTRWCDSSWDLGTALVKAT